MNFFKQVLKVEFLSFVHNKTTGILLLLLLCCCWSISLFIPEETSHALIPVGVAIPEGSVHGEELFSYLENENNLVEFLYASEDDIQRNVAAGHWECGFILNHEFDERIESRRYTGLFQVLINEGTSMDVLVSESVTTAMLELVADDLGDRYLKSVGADIEGIDYKIDEDLKFEIHTVINGDLDFEQITSSYSADIMNGMISVILIALAIILGDGVAKKFQSLYYQRLLAMVGYSRLLLPMITGSALLIGAFYMILTLFLGGYFHIAIIPYLLCLTAFSYLISITSNGYFSIGLPFIIPILLILTPIFFSVTTYFAPLKYIVNLLPSSLYINAISGSTSAWIGLLGLSVLYLLISYIKQRFLSQ